MRYIKQFLNKLTDNVIVTKSKVSNSEYYMLDNGFTIRLSDHIPITEWKATHICVVECFHSDKFVLFLGKSNIPMIKTRKEVKEHIRVTYENWFMERQKTLSDISHKLIKVPFKCVTPQDFIELNPDFAGYSDKQGKSLSLLAIHPTAFIIPKELRSYMFKTFVNGNKDINVAEFLSIAVSNAKKIKDTESANNAVKCYLNNKQKHLDVS